MSQGNKLCARPIACLTSVASRTTNGKHSVQPVAISTIVKFWMNEPLTEIPPVRDRLRRSLVADHPNSQKFGLAPHDGLRMRSPRAVADRHAPQCERSLSGRSSPHWRQAQEPDWR